MKNIGIYNKGRIKRTKHQIKKHVSQMNEIEKEYLANAIASISSKIRFSKHFISSEVKCEKEHVAQLLNCKNLLSLIVEYNETNNGSYVDRRVLVRDGVPKEVTFFSNASEPFIAPANLCVVVSIVTGRIITAYWNLKDDDHKTIDWKRYDANLKVIK